MQYIPDQTERTRALDPTQSFIVQAPAGSGKTELLVQRYLTLLNHVNHPEEIIAITFTRKAAAEMRNRILNALESKGDSSLFINPNRLRIFTIDAMCNYLTRQMPILSHFGATPEILEDAEDCYQQAARSVLLSLNSQQPWTEALRHLLLHLDNNYVQVEQLFIDMLKKRDQWLPHILAARTSSQLRSILEQNLIRIILGNIKNCHELFPQQIKSEFIELICFAANNLKKNYSNSLITHCDSLKDFPSITIEDLPKWQGIAQLLLTTTFQWRKEANIKIGFPAKNSGRENALMKEKMENLLTHMQDHVDLRQNLENLLNSPASQYSDTQWHILTALLELLPILAAELTIIFHQKNQVDFIEIVSAAMKALGEPDAPTDLALHLDYQIKHILVDEFQDTSFTQFRLLESLTAGWQNNDGRTLFIVGDPMQSIYRFRQAEVGLFLQVKHHGIGHLHLHALHLKANFRSNADLVEWSNQIFKEIFPKQENIATGAITFATAIAIKMQNALEQVKIYPFINANDDEATTIVNIIQGIQQKNSEETTAILVRSRSHLQTIIPALKQAGIKFQGIEIDKLYELPLIQDLYALTRASLHLADRIAWLAILRAPWCGLQLSDLYILANYQSHYPLWNTLINWEQISELSADAKLRLARVIKILQKHLQNRDRKIFRNWIEEVWQSIGGPACLTNETEISYAEAYFNLLEQIPRDVDKAAWLSKKLPEIYAPPLAGITNKLQIMTIHKAKGLEFDNVILPSLHRKLPYDENQLLMWMERATENSTDLILAPIKSSYTDYDSIYKYLRQQEKLKTEYETMRLLYVAATRAKNKLFLLGNTKVNDKKSISEPAANTFLSLLWSTMQPLFNSKLNSTDSLFDAEQLVPKKTNLNRQRLVASWQLPEFHYENTSSDLNLIVKDDITNKYKLTDQNARLVGIVVHQMLQKISEQGSKTWSLEKTEQYKPYWRNWLIQYGTLERDIEKNIAAIETTLQKILTDPKAHWILDITHQEAKSEFPITAIINDQIHHLVIDRTFVDAKGIRWIIDYKTATFKETNTELEKFIATQKEIYQTQLTHYAKALRLIETRPIYLGLYFPAFSGWCEWEFEEN